MSRELAKAYDPREVEDRWARQWVREGLFTAAFDPAREPFSIVIPPPNITGQLHLGHALNNTLQDVLIRYKKMDGYDTLADRPRFDRDPERRGAPARGAGDRPASDRPREVSRSGPSPGGRGRPLRIRSCSAPGRRLRLDARALHDGRGPLAGGPRGLRPPPRGRPDLPGPTPHQLVLPLRDGALRHRGRARGGRGPAVAPPLSARGRLGRARRRDHASRDDARRHRGRGSSRRRAIAPGSGGRSSFRYSAARSRSSRTSTSIGSSARAPSRSPRRTTSTTSRSARATGSTRSR